MFIHLSPIHLPLHLPISFTKLLSSFGLILFVLIAAAFFHFGIKNIMVNEVLYIPSRSFSSYPEHISLLLLQGPISITKS